MKTIKHNNLHINIGERGHYYLSIDKSKMKDYSYGYINSNLSLDANGNEVECEEDMIMPTIDYFFHKDTRISTNLIDINYGIKDREICLTERIELIDGLNVISQKTEIVNNGVKSERIARLSSACVTGIGIGGSKYFENPNRFLVYYAYNRMQGEGQWQKKTLKELGLYPGSRHKWEKCTFRLQSFGSWATKEYYPLLIIEDTEKNECWFFEREGAFNWYIEINAFEGYECPFINVSIGGMDEKCGWYYDLKPNERYITNKCFYGVVKGGFDDAIKELISYKRRFQKTCTKIEVVFNDFMNCYWGKPNKERLIHLIDKASEVGCECFCIDDGWAIAGEWNPLENLFPNGGLKSIIRYINEKGMRAGLWFEFEKVADSVVDILGEEVLLKRNNIPIANYRHKLDLRNEKARNWLFSKIDYVYSLGVRYIKNDHNNDEGVGTNYIGENIAEGGRRKHSAFIKFLCDVHDRYPDLIIENCSAGGGRMEFETLKHCSLQSLTDQEDYKLLPSIISGCMAEIQPEKAGIWSYPFPLLFKDYLSFIKPQEEIDESADGRETIFNMVNGMSGCLYLSGRIDLMDEKNFQLVKDGIKVYKSYRDSIGSRYPIFPVGLKNMCDKDYNVLGLINIDNKDLLLFVWCLEQTLFDVDLSKYNLNQVSKLYGDKARFSLMNGILKVDFSQKYSAVILNLKHHN